MDYSVPKRFFELPQSSMITCWAATAAMLKSYSVGHLKMEKEILKEPFLTQFNNSVILGFGDVVRFFETEMQFKAENVPAEGFKVAQWKTMLQKYGPLIVPAPVLGTRDAHVRVMYGIWGTDKDDNSTQFKLYDPAGILANGQDESAGVNNRLRILHEHLQWQVEGSVPLIGSRKIIWHL